MLKGLPPKLLRMWSLFLFSARRHRFWEEDGPLEMVVWFCVILERDGKFSSEVTMEFYQTRYCTDQVPLFLAQALPWAALAPIETAAGAGEQSTAPVSLPTESQKLGRT